MRDDSGAAGVIAFAIGGVLFLVAAGALMLLARTSVPLDQASDADPAGTLRAQAALGILLTEGTSGTAGTAGWDDAPTTSQAWTESSTAYFAPGLLDAHGRLDRLKLDNARLAPRAAAADGLLNRDELARDLGLAGDGLRFHLRMTPLLPEWETDPLPLTFHYVAGTVPAEEALLQDLTGGTSIPWTVGACATYPDLLVYGTGHADSPLPNIDQAVQCGMTLILLGSATPCSSCLAPLVGSAPPDSSCAPLRSRDLAHPLLSAPNAVGVGDYVPLSGSASPSLGAAASAFDTVVGDLPDPVLSVSLCGTFGAGRIIVARLSPTDLYGTGTPTTREGTRLLHNMLVRHDEALSLDLGDTLPEGIAAAPAVAIAAGPGGVPVRLALWVFP